MKPQTIAAIRNLFHKKIACINFRFRDVNSLTDYLAVNSTSWSWGEIMHDSLKSIQAIVLNDSCNSYFTLDANTPNYVLLSSLEELQFFKPLNQATVVNMLRTSYGKADEEIKKKMVPDNFYDDLYIPMA